ncbi:mucin-5B-like isoform X2 [Petromyzon marinus]|uniref:mucin-5B-like isoform X2 n=1 Tax=Petromyzon marinus TaxID=7757 RepID=UPI003F6EFB81
MDHEGECVPGIECPCYTGHDIVPPGKFYWVGDLACACEYGVLRCENPITMLGGRMRRESPLQVENALQLLVDGSALRGRSHTKACERTCQTINLPCPPCESDCPCGDGFIPDDNGNCIPRRIARAGTTALSMARGIQSRWTATCARAAAARGAATRPSALARAACTGTATTSPSTARGSSSTETATPASCRWAPERTRLAHARHGLTSGE